MRTILFFLLGLVVLFGIGCEYEAALVEEDVVKVDEEVVGVWQSVDEDGEKVEMAWLAFSDTEYVIHYPLGKEGMYFRGYAIELGGVECVQVQLIGTDKGAVKAKDRKCNVVKYKLEGDCLEVSLLNSDVVNREINDSKKLRELFIENKNNEELFEKPSRFKRLKKDSEAGLVF